MPTTRTDDTSMLVYAWAEGQRSVTVLGKPPVRSAPDAMRAYFAGDAEGA